MEIALTPCDPVDIEENAFHTLVTRHGCTFNVVGGSHSLTTSNVTYCDGRTYPL
jgi:hypothetical protein